MKAVEELVWDKIQDGILRQALRRSGQFGEEEINFIVAMLERILSE